MKTFNNFNEAATYAQSINANVHMYAQRAGQSCWEDLGAIYKPIEVATDDEDAQWFERVEEARYILTGMDDFNDWYEGYMSRIIQAFKDLEQAKAMVEFAANLREAVEDLEEGEEAVAVNDNEFDVIDRFPTMGEYDGRRWMLSVSESNED